MRPSKKLQRYLEENPKFARNVYDVVAAIEDCANDLVIELIGVEKHRSYASSKEAVRLIGKCNAAFIKLDRLITRKSKELAR